MRSTILLLVWLLFACPPPAGAQHTQRVRGKVVDKETRNPLAGVTVWLPSMQPAKGTATNTDGEFVIVGVPSGKHTIALSYPGYHDVDVPNLLVTTGKEVVLLLEMEETTMMLGEVTVSGRKEHINEMAIVSARKFDVEETDRYAGSRGDPARMAANFAGVSGADDSRNDIIVRGNSPQGILWRLEGIDIPNPNHFAIPGTTGGPVSMLNNKTLSNSEFFMGAFPAEYGNCVAGVFDLNLRNGNNRRYEVSGQLGFLGTELTAEGPISKKNGSSFLLSYRYATLKLFEGLKIPIGTGSVPNYQDGSFKLNFPMGDKSTLSFFGLGGLSNIDLVVSKFSEPPDEIYGESDRDQYFASNTGIIGAGFHHIINESAYTKLTLAQTANEINASHYKVFRDAEYQVDSLKNILGYDFLTKSTVVHWYVNKKFSPKHILRAGIINNLYQLNLIDSSRQYPASRQDWQHRLHYRGHTNLLQAYMQYKYRYNDALTFTGGLHAQHLSHNNTMAIEPRAGVRWKTDSKNIVSLGYGLHSQTQALYQYFHHLPQQPPGIMHNYDMGFTRSHHLVGGYEHIFTPQLRFRTEAYYQYLFNIPIEASAGSSFSLINQGASFSRLFPGALVNEGTGYNYGLELTLEKIFSRGYYFMVTGSLFDSKARGQDGVYRNTDYNCRFALNFLGGYERKLGENSSFFAGGKITYTGGRLFSPPDIAASTAVGDLVVIDSLRNTLQFPDYFRTDLKLGIRINRPRLTHEIAIDLVNVLGTRNVLSQTYNADLAMQGAYPFVREYQLGFLPLFYYKVDFGFGRN